MKRLFISLLLASSTPAFAQADRCIPPQIIDLPGPIHPDGPSRRTAIGGYTLALSWSPEFCHGQRGQGRGRQNPMQCSGANGHFGFIVHGLWPEGAGTAPPPQWCALTPRPSVDLIRRNLCRTPVPWLLEHEWDKHGSCMAATPEAYFQQSQVLWQALHLPDMARLSYQHNLHAGDLRHAFVALNRGWQVGQIGLHTNAKGWLEELRLCYSRQLQPVACSRDHFGPDDGAQIKIQRGQ